MPTNSSVISPIGNCRKMPSMSHSTTHAPQTRNIVSRGRFWLASLSFLLVRASLGTSLFLVGWILFQTGAIPSAVLTILTVAIVTLIVAGMNVLANSRKVTCPLCRASLFMSSRNLVKPRVQKILGCSKTPLAFSLLTMPEVKSCPCCAEKVRLTRSS